MSDHLAHQPDGNASAPAVAVVERGDAHQAPMALRARSLRDSAAPSAVATVSSKMASSGQPAVWSASTSASVTLYAWRRTLPRYALASLETSPLPNAARRTDGAVVPGPSTTAARIASMRSVAGVERGFDGISRLLIDQRARSTLRAA